LATIGLGAAGLYFANNLRQQTRFRLADARRDAYAKLWELTKIATPTRLDLLGWEGTLKKNEREQLYRQTTDWYYEDGNGMLLEEPTRSVYLNAKHNLLCEDDELRPANILESLPARMTSEQKRGCLSIRQISLLRTQMKTDLAIFGVPFASDLRRHERWFLMYSGVRLTRKPWDAASAMPAPPEDCGKRPFT
jgi:hypothetical protein